MKRILYILLFLSATCFGQNKFITKTGSLNFEASVPSFEEVAAKNNSVTVIINAENGEIAALALVKAFRFKNALMEEHFNENYAESDKFPKATFKGKLLAFSFEKLIEVNDLFIEGELEFHGVSKHFDKIPVTLEYSNDKIILSGNFSAKASDFDIKIPKIVQSKVKDEVQINFNFELLKK
ncbi:MAG: YceI family protein [Aequorivita antarctica]